MLEKLLLYDNQQPRPLIMLRNILMVRLIDYPKGVLAVMLGNGDKLFIKLFGITIHIIGNLMRLKEENELGLNYLNFLIVIYLLEFKLNY